MEKEFNQNSTENLQYFMELLVGNSKSDDKDVMYLMKILSLMNAWFNYNYLFYIENNIIRLPHNTQHIKFEDKNLFNKVFGETYNNSITLTNKQAIKKTC